MKKYRILLSAKASKKYEKLTQKDKILQKKIQSTLLDLKIDPYKASLKTHKVNLKEHGVVCSSRVTGDIRIIWKFINNEIKIIILDIGGHSGKQGVYK